MLCRCLCTPGFCGIECALQDPCMQPGGAGAGAGEGPDGASAGNSTGPCLHGGACEQRCAALTDYVCHCIDGWGGKNCSQQVLHRLLNNSPRLIFVRADGD